METGRRGVPSGGDSPPAGRKPGQKVSCGWCGAEVQIPRAGGSRSGAPPPVDTELGSNAGQLRLA